jgi:lipopolysaccharide transport system permease protein
MMTQFADIFRASDLLWAWTGRNIRGRYQQSVLGWFWAVVQPVATAVVFAVIFTLFVPIDTGDTPYILFSYVAMVPWTLFSSSLVDMTDSIVNNMDLVKKIYFPREILPLASMLARLMDFGVASVLIIVMMIIFKTPLSPLSLFFLPLILSVQLMLIMGIGLLGAALNVFVRDVRSLLTLGIQLWFYASPIIYPITVIPERFRQFYYFNPMAGILTAYRDVLIDGETPGLYMIPSSLVAIAVFILGYLFFKKVEFTFADIV